MEQEARQFSEKLDALRREIGRVIVGHDDVIRQILICLVAGGHALLEGVPGLGKTLLVRTLSDALELRFSRIQFTPDLMPADILGTNIIVEEPFDSAQGVRRSFQFQKGPIFGNVILADEINRATPKTQSALLEVMQEQAVTMAGTRYPLEGPFLVLATQNPIEMEGTYPLPEAQLDRFLFKVEIRSPELRDLVEIIDRTTQRSMPQAQPVLAGPDVMRLRELVRDVVVPTHVAEYAARLVLATHSDRPSAAEVARKYVRYGASPRGAQALVLSGKVLALMKGRFNVSREEVRESIYPALRHRLILNFEGEAEGIRPDEIIRQILESTPEVSKEVEKLAAGR